MRPHHKDLIDHALSDKHKKNAGAVPSHKGSNQGTLLSHGFKVKSEASKVLDLKLAAHVACHSSVKTIDHLGELLKCVAKGSTAMEQLRLHRTKCGKYICKVLAPSILKDIIADIGDE
ncbi:hypothetical protein FOCC_FOCC012657 [Frankliniella occidentalis]|nr:hypothetical protein FOCC_FOCC012657 [Frankliniella occidentalis]